MYYFNKVSSASELTVSFQYRASRALTLLLLAPSTMRVLRIGYSHFFIRYAVAYFDYLSVLPHLYCLRHCLVSSSLKHEVVTKGLATTIVVVSLVNVNAVVVVVGLTGSSISPSALRSAS